MAGFLAPTVAYSTQRAAQEALVVSFVEGAKKRGMFEEISMQSFDSIIWELIDEILTQGTRMRASSVAKLLFVSSRSQATDSINLFVDHGIPHLNKSRCYFVYSDNIHARPLDTIDAGNLASGLRSCDGNHNQRSMRHIVRSFCQSLVYPWISEDKEADVREETILSAGVLLQHLFKAWNGDSFQQGYAWPFGIRAIKKVDSDSNLARLLQAGHRSVRPVKYAAIWGHGRLRLRIVVDTGLATKEVQCFSCTIQPYPDLPEILHSSVFKGAKVQGKSTTNYEFASFTFLATVNYSHRDFLDNFNHRRHTFTAVAAIACSCFLQAMEYTSAAQDNKKHKEQASMQRHARSNFHEITHLVSDNMPAIARRQRKERQAHKTAVSMRSLIAQHKILVSEPEDHISCTSLIARPNAANELYTISTSESTSLATSSVDTFATASADQQEEVDVLRGVELDINAEPERALPAIGDSADGADEFTKHNLAVKVQSSSCVAPENELSSLLELVIRRESSSSVIKATGTFSMTSGNGWAPDPLHREGDVEAVPQVTVGSQNSEAHNENAMSFKGPKCPLDQDLPTTEYEKVSPCTTVSSVCRLRFPEPPVRSAVPFMQYQGSENSAGLLSPIRGKHHSVDPWRRGPSKIPAGRQPLECLPPSILHTTPAPNTSTTVPGQGSTTTTSRVRHKYKARSLPKSTVTDIHLTTARLALSLQASTRTHSQTPRNTASFQSARSPESAASSSNSAHLSRRPMPGQLITKILSEDAKFSYKCPPAVTSCGLPACWLTTSSSDCLTVTCPRCGPYSYVRYCCIQHLHGDARRHYIEDCTRRTNILPYLDEETIEPTCPATRLFPAVVSAEYDSFERHRQALYFTHPPDSVSDYFIFGDADVLLGTEGPDVTITPVLLAKYRGTGPVAATVRVGDKCETKQRFVNALRRLLLLGTAACTDNAACVSLYIWIKDNLRDRGLWDEDMVTRVCLAMQLEFGWRVPTRLL